MRGLARICVAHIANQVIEFTNELARSITGQAGSACQMTALIALAAIRSAAAFSPYQRIASGKDGPLRTLLTPSRCCGAAHRTCRSLRVKTIGCAGGQRCLLCDRSICVAHKLETFIGTALAVFYRVWSGRLSRIPNM